ncbi:hypothetical protein RFI_37825, partial [Reticulomyxa filosa]
SNSKSKINTLNHLPMKKKSTLESNELGNVPTVAHTKHTDLLEQLQSPIKKQLAKKDNETGQKKSNEFIPSRYNNNKNNHFFKIMQNYHNAGQNCRLTQNQGQYKCTFLFLILFFIYLGVNSAPLNKKLLP